MSGLNDYNFDNAKVLVCDDDPTHLLIMREVLESQGFEFYQAEDGKQSINQYFAINPDIVLLDINMPHANGYEVCKEIRESIYGKDVPILMVTGADDTDSIEQAFESGGTDFLSKPINWTLVAYRIKYILRNSMIYQEHKNNEDRLSYLAYYDSLTGLPNKQNFLKQLEDYLETSKYNDMNVAVVKIDLDKFKKVNEALGKKYGDKLLQIVADKLEKFITARELISKDSELQPISHLNSKEFALFFAVNSLSELKETINYLLEQIALPVKMADVEFSISASSGVALFPKDGDSAEKLLSKAEAATFDAKSQGGNCFSFCSESMINEALNKMLYAEKINHTLKNHGFKLNYSAQINVLDNSVRALEVSIYDSKDESFDNKIEYIDTLSENNSTAKELDMWIIYKVFEQLGVWKKNNVEIYPVAIKISTYSLLKANFIENVMTLLMANELDANLIEFEITDHLLVKAANESNTILASLQLLGFSIAIENFTESQSSIAYLPGSGVKVCKIPTNLVKELAQNKDRLKVIKSIVAMAKELDLTVIATDVSGREQVNQLTALGCEIMQGEAIDTLHGRAQNNKV